MSIENNNNSSNDICPDVKILTPIGMLGYGFSTSLLNSSILEHSPDAIIIDSGSTDSGPQKLALGSTTCPREAYVNDFKPLLAACFHHKIPLIISSCGGDGSDAHVDMFMDIIQTYSGEKGYSFKILKLYSEVDKKQVLEYLGLNKIVPCGPVHELTPALIDDTPRIVSQMGYEPILAAMEEHPDFDIAIIGRAYDPAPYAAFTSFKSHRMIPLGLSYHMGKIMECGALCAEPKGKSAMATIHQDSFDIRPLDKGARCTAMSVAAHTLYEKARPDILYGPGGYLDLTKSTYQELPDQISVSVRGGVFVEVEDGKYTLKLEGAKTRGFRTIFIGGIRDPILIDKIDDYIAGVKRYITSVHPGVEYEIIFHVYGKDGVMGDFEPSRGVDSPSPHELCIIGEVQASSQALATTISSTARVACIHGPYPGQLATAGNFAMPFSPLDMPLGEVCEFSIYHLMEIDNPHSFVRTVVSTINSKKRARIEDEVDLSGQNPAQKYRPPPVQRSPSNQKPKYLSDAAKVIRSKNAGPFELTFDVIFPATTAHIYYAIKSANPPILSAEVIADIYQLRKEDVFTIWWDQALAFKATIPRPRPSGGFGERDVHGCQFHAPLLSLKIDHLDLKF